MTSPQTLYSTLPIPKDPRHLANLATKFREEKLSALTTDPQAFATTYAAECDHPLSVWLSRLDAPSTNYVCLATPYPIPEAIRPGSIYAGNDAVIDAAVGLLLSAEWAGMVTLNGPVPFEAYHIPQSGQPHAADPSTETRWHMHNMYTSYAHRGKGLAKLLIKSVMEYATLRSREIGPDVKARVRLFCNPKNPVVMGLYRGAGFGSVGTVTLEDAFIANGDPEGVPKDSAETEEGRAKWHTRYGIVMDKVV
jgi:ribosomal protein S18 acetylase RimI-like enzyme